MPATNHLAQVLREMGRAEREAEELRLKKRQKRLLGDTAANGSRAGSVAPGTPGSTAPEPEKAPTKKEQKKMRRLRRKAEQQDKRDRIKMGLLPPDPPKGTLELMTKHRRTTDMNLQSAWRT